MLPRLFSTGLRTRLLEFGLLALLVGIAGGVALLTFGPGEPL